MVLVHRPGRPPSGVDGRLKAEAGARQRRNDQGRGHGNAPARRVRDMARRPRCGRSRPQQLSRSHRSRRAACDFATRNDSVAWGGSADPSGRRSLVVGACYGERGGHVANLSAIRSVRSRVPRAAYVPPRSLKAVAATPCPKRFLSSYGSGNANLSLAVPLRYGATPPTSSRGTAQRGVSSFEVGVREWPTQSSAKTKLLPAASVISRVSSSFGRPP